MRYRYLILRSFFITVVLMALYVFLDYILPVSSFMFLFWLLANLVIFFMIVSGLISTVIIFINLFSKKKIHPFALIVSISMFTIVLFVCLLKYVPLPLPVRPLPTGSDLLIFNSHKWKMKASTHSNKGISEREKMLKDLCEKVLPGESKSQIIDLLGEPLNTSYFKDINKDMIYFLGPERDMFFAIDGEWLLIWLDETGYFEKYKVLND